MTGWPRLAQTYRRSALFLVVFAAPTALHAQPVREACPDRAAVLRALRALSARDARGVPATLDEPLAVSIEDDGDAYRVSVNGRTRSYADSHRDCAERAQVAAVFAALVLSSPNAVDAEPEPAAALPPAPGAPPPPASAAAGIPRFLPAFHLRRWWFDAGVALALAPGVAGPPVEPGLELGLAYVPGDVGLALGFRLPAAPALVPVGAATAHLLRYPIDAVARWVLHAPPFEGTLDAGGVLALLRVRPAADSGRGTQGRIELGFRVATRWQLAKSAISPYAELFSEVIPTRYPLALEPTGALAKTPGFWVAAALGISAHFD